MGNEVSLETFDNGQCGWRSEASYKMYKVKSDRYKFLKWTKGWVESTLFGLDNFIQVLYATTKFSHFHPTQDRHPTISLGAYGLASRGLRRPIFSYKTKETDWSGFLKGTKEWVQFHIRKDNVIRHVLWGIRALHLLTLLCGALSLIFFPSSLTKNTGKHYYWSQRWSQTKQTDQSKIL